MAIRLSATRLDLSSASLTNAELRGWSETVSALGNVTGATTIDLSLGNVITATTTGATTWTVTNASSTQTSSFTLILTNGGSAAQTWMSGTQWANGTAPTLNSSGTDVLTFFTTDAGTTWRGAKGGPAPVDQTGQKLFVWGDNTQGYLGLGDTIKRSSPVQLSGQWAQIDNGGDDSSHQFGIKSNGVAYAWGNGSTGALGLGDTISRSSPAQLPGTWSVVRAAGKGPMSIGLRSDGSLWVWGRNTNGYLGLSDTIARSSPTQISGTWKDIGTGSFNFRGIRSDGSLWSWGYRASGQLGLGNNVTTNSPVQVLGTWISVSGNGGIKSDGSLWTWGYNTAGQSGLGDVVVRSSPVQVLGTWKQIVSEFSMFSNFLRHDGTLWTSGYNLHGQLGLGNTVWRSSPVQIGTGLWSNISSSGSASVGLAFGLTPSGSLFVWGGNPQGRLGLGDTLSRSSPTQLSGTWSLARASSASGMGFKL